MTPIFVPNFKWSDALRVSLPAIVMPFVFSGAPALLMGNEDLLRLSWQTIVPSSWLGALIIAFTQPMKSLAEGAMSRFGKALGAGLCGALIAAVLGAITVGITALMGWDLSLAWTVASSAGIGAGVAAATEIASKNPTLESGIGEKPCISS